MIIPLIKHNIRIYNHVISIKICEFGYVLTDEKFKILDRNNMIINPNIMLNEWDDHVVRTILTREVNEYEESPKFDHYYEKIVKLIKDSDYVFGHSINGDAKALNCDCQRYGLPSIDFKFYDIKEFYKQYNSSKNDTSVINILKELKTQGEDGEHDAEVDAVNTMYEFKAILQKLEMSAVELIGICPTVVDYNENFVVQSLEIARLIKEERMKKMLSGESSNLMLKKSKQYKTFIKFLDNVLPTTNEKKTLEGLKFSITINYEEFHYKQMLNIVQLLCNKGASYVMKASLCDVFVTYKVLNEDGTERACSKNKYVNEAIEEGANIRVISFDEFVEMLGLTEAKLDELPMVSLDCLYRKDAIIKDPKDKKHLTRKNVVKEPVTVPDDSNNTLGNLFGDIFAKLKKDLED